MNNRGQSLINVMVSLAISSILMLVTMQIMDNQNKSLRYYVQKSDVLELKSAISQTLNNSEMCKWQLSSTGIKINTSNLAAQQINLTKIHAGIDGSSPVLVEVGKQVSPGLNTDSIKFHKFFSTGKPGIYRATLEIAFSQVGGNFRSVAPLKLDKNIYVKTTDPANAQEIIGCGGGAGESGGIACEPQKAPYHGWNGNTVGASASYIDVPYSLDAGEVRVITQAFCTYKIQCIQGEVRIFEGYCPPADTGGESGGSSGD